MKFNIGSRGGDSEASRTQRLLFSVLFMLIGVGMLGLGYTTFQSQNQQLEDPVNVTAEVVSTGVDRDSSRRGSPDYTPVITFEYMYNGTEYSSDSMYPGGQEAEEYSSETSAESVTDEYSTGSNVEVFVPPESPGEAFIKAKKTDDPLIFMGIGVLMIGAGLYRYLNSL